MLEIKNNKKFPVQLIVKSNVRTKSFTTLIVPGVGRGKNIYLLEDERVTDYIDRAVKDGLITTRHIPNKKLKGE
jgi:hypothetical protein